MNIANNITELIGNTPLVKLQEASKLTGATILGKCEFLNPTGSVKDRIGFNMLRRAIEEGKIDSQTVVIEPTSGNTGIALAANCAALGIELVLTMPDSMSIERRKLLSAFGAKLVLTPASLGMQGSIDKAYELQKQYKKAIVLQQFQNQHNPQIHKLTTAWEILNDTDAKVDAFVAAVGTGGTLSGTATVLKQELPNIKVFAVEPSQSAVLSGKAPSAHKIQGIGAGFVPDILDTTIYDEVITVENQDAFDTARMIAKKEGLLVGISSGANLFAAMEVAKREQFQGKTIVTILCDTGERYLSTELFE
jgi:cysteine synthase A